MAELEPTEAAYIAGIIDGEGSLCLQLVRLDRENEVLRPRLQVANTNLNLLRWLQEIIGFGYIRPAVPFGDRKHKDNWRYSIYAVVGIRQVLEVVMPYIVAKRRQAELLMAFCEKHKLGSPATKAEVKMFTELKELNKKGKVV